MYHLTVIPIVDKGEGIDNCIVEQPPEKTFNTLHRRENVKTASASC